MPTVTARTVPVRGHIRIYRVMGRYGIMAEGTSPVAAAREYPWSYLVEGEAFIDPGGNLWLPEIPQVRGICEVDCYVTYRYINMGPAEEWL